MTPPNEQLKKMVSKFFCTNLATDWQEDELVVGPLLKLLHRLTPDANPGYQGRMHLIDRWLIEVEAAGQLGREVGLTKENEIAVAGPSDRDYGFWCDTNMTETDLAGQEISPTEFERYWKLSAQFRREK